MERENLQKYNKDKSSVLEFLYTIIQIPGAPHENIRLGSDTGYIAAIINNHYGTKIKPHELARKTLGQIAEMISK